IREALVLRYCIGDCSALDGASPHSPLGPPRRCRGASVGDHGYRCAWDLCRRRGGIDWHSLDEAGSSYRSARVVALALLTWWAFCAMVGNSAGHRLWLLTMEVFC